MSPGKSWKQTKILFREISKLGRKSKKLCYFLLPGNERRNVKSNKGSRGRKRGHPMCWSSTQLGACVLRYLSSLCQYKKPEERLLKPNEDQNSRCVSLKGIRHYLSWKFSNFPFSFLVSRMVIMSTFYDLPKFDSQILIYKKDIEFEIR